MTSQASIEDHYDILESRAEVFSVEIDKRIPMPSIQFDRGVGFLVERGSVHSHQSRPRRKAA
ncbi:hypothetical protein NN6n1_12960 [Shinella zoogloeoides]